MISLTNPHHHMELPTVSIMLYSMPNKQYTRLIEGIADAKNASVVLYPSSDRDVHFDSINADRAIEIARFVDPTQHCGLIVNDASDFIKIRSAAGIVVDLETFKSTRTSASLDN